MVEGYKAYIGMNDGIKWIILINGVAMERYPRSIIKQINQKMRIKDLATNSESYGNIINGQETIQIHYGKKMLQQIVFGFNISLKEQSLVSFTMKLHAELLPCNLRQFCWGFANYSHCSQCEETEDNTHVITCRDQKSTLENVLYGAKEKCQSIRNQKDPILMSTIKRCLVENFTISTAMGFIPTQLILLWRERED